MKVLVKGLALAGALCGLVLGLAACGGSSSSSSSSSGGGSSSGTTLKPALDGSGQNLTDGTKGGTLTVYDHEDFEHLDPGQTYFSLDYEVVYATQRPLFMLPAEQLRRQRSRTSRVRSRDDHRRRQDGDRAHPSRRALQPAGQPRGDLGRRRVRDRARREPERRQRVLPVVLLLHRGCEQGDRRPDPRDLDARHSTTIVFHLTGPYGTFFVGALSMPLTAPGAEGVRGAARQAEADDITAPKYLVATGPYMFKSDSKGKFLGIGYQPGKSATLVRNPNWNASTDPRPAYLDQININIGGDPNVIGRQVLTGSHTVQNDTPAGPIVEAGLPELLQPAGRGSGCGRPLRVAQQQAGPVRERQRSQGACGRRSTARR